MKKVFITISLVIPILLSAAPVFAALSTTPASSANFSDLQVTVTSLDNRRVILVNPSGIVSGDTDASHGFPYPFADGTYSPSQLGFTASGLGLYTIISTYQAENGLGSCLPGSTMASCLSMIAAGAGYYSESTFELLAPPPYTTINGTDFPIPSFAANIAESVGNVLAGSEGLLGILIVAMAVPLFFWFMKEFLAMIHQNQKSK